MFATLLASIAAGETADMIGRAKRAAMAYAVAGLLFLLAVIFGLVAIYVWAAVRYGPINAALAFAAGFVVLAVLVLVIQAVTAKVQTRRAARRRAVDVKAIATTAAIAAVPALLARGRPSAATLVVPVLGIIGYLIFKENKRSRRPPSNQ